MVLHIIDLMVKSDFFILHIKLIFFESSSELTQLLIHTLT